MRVDRHLRSVSRPQVFASGDCARWDAAALPKAGVFAVRLGPPLAHNLRVALGLAGTGSGAGSGALEPYRSQRRYLVLLATGDRRAIASRGPFGAEGAWAWHWKDHIDRRFIDRFRRPADGAALPFDPPAAKSALTPG